ncbi:MAG TPA: HAD-IIB family hydrolase [Candidatus Paceibacterota bacterium]|nr:HAD-IIB family hydrolase [Candidatus Paceibacterota bacterium]
MTPKELIVFDLDGTLAPSKAPMRPDMSKALAALLAKKKVAVIGGGSYEQFSRQFVGRLKVPKALLPNLFLFPTTSTSFYRYRNGWKKVYRKVLKATEKKRIMAAFDEAFAKTGYRHPKKHWGPIIEDRDSQITFSALGQAAPIPAKEAWNKKSDVRPALMRIMQRHLPDFEVRRGGLTSIDVTRKGIDKAFGVRQIKKVLKIPIANMLFVGDALYPGGNDYAAKKTGIDCIPVKDPSDTKKVIKRILTAR